MDSILKTTNVWGVPNSHYKEKLGLTIMNPASFIALYERTNT